MIFACFTFVCSFYWWFALVLLFVEKTRGYKRNPPRGVSHKMAPLWHRGGPRKFSGGNFHGAIPVLKRSKTPGSIQYLPISIFAPFNGKIICFLRFNSGIEVHQSREQVAITI